MKLSLISINLTLLMTTGCAALSSLRSDFTQMPDSTIGGAFPEGGLLDDEEDRVTSSLERGGRSIASDGSPVDPESRPRSWVSNQDQASQSRDQVRQANGEPSYSNQHSLLPKGKRAYKNGVRATRDDFLDESRNEGSLWAGDGQTNFFFSKNKIRTVGDILTITTEEAFIKDIAAEIGRTLTPKERSEEVDLAQARMSQDTVKSSSAGATRSPASPAGKAKGGKEEATADQRSATEADIDVSKSMGIKAGDPIMAEIVERYPNGNYKVHGSKKVPYRGGFRYVSVLAIVRTADVTDEETVSSGKLYEYRLEALR